MTEALFAQDNELTALQRSYSITNLDLYTRFLTLDLSTTSAADILDASLDRRKALQYFLRASLEIIKPARAEMSEGIAYGAPNDLPILLSHERYLISFFRKIVKGDITSQQEAGIIDVATYNRLLGIRSPLLQDPYADEYLAAVFAQESFDESDESVFQNIEQIEKDLEGMQKDAASFSNILFHAYPTRLQELRYALHIVKTELYGEKMQRALQVLGVFYWYTGIDRHVGYFNLTDILETIEMMTDTVHEKSRLFQERVIGHFSGTLGNAYR